MSRGADANFDNLGTTGLPSLKANAGHSYASPIYPVMNGRAWGVLVCDTTVNDALFSYDYTSFFRTSDLRTNQNYKARRYTFQINVATVVTLSVVAVGFTPLITIQRWAGKEVQATHGLSWEVTLANTGEFVVEVTSVEPGATGTFVLTTTCSASTAMCQPPVAIDNKYISVDPGDDSWEFDQLEDGWWLCAVKSNTADQGCWVWINGMEAMLTTWELYTDSDIQHFWFYLKAGHYTANIYATGIAHSVNIRYWSLKTYNGSYGFYDPAAYDSQCFPGYKCWYVDLDLTAGDVYVIRPMNFILDGALATCGVGIYNLDSSSVLEQLYEKTVWTVPATAHYRFEVYYGLDPTMLTVLVGFSIDCWICADMTVSPATGTNPVSMTVSNDSVKHSSLTYAQSIWRTDFVAIPGEEGSATIDTEVVSSNGGYGQTLYCWFCTGYADYYVNLEVSDANYRCDKINSADLGQYVRVSGTRPSDTSLGTDSGFYNFVADNISWLNPPTIPWDGTLDRVEPSCAYGIGGFGVRSYADATPSSTPQQWEFEVQYAAIMLRYNKDTRTHNPKGTYTITNTVFDESIPHPPSTLEIL